MSRPRRPGAAAVLPFLFILVLAFGGWLRAAGPDEAGARPRLVVVVVVDQLRADYLERFADRFGAGGFKRLTQEGAYFVSCFIPYANTVTAAGHATIATGTTPDRHGIVGNSWFNSQLGRGVAAIFDASKPVVGGANTNSGASPHNLMGTTFGDELRLATGGQAIVLGVSIKDRSAILSTGQLASGAYWYEAASGRFVTSLYYGQELPAWVAAFNQEKGAKLYAGKDWKRGDKVFVSLQTANGEPDPSFFRRILATPYGNDMVIDFALESIEREGLGADAVTDLLFVGLSSNDAVGHTWGPYSDEVADMTVQTDVQIARLLASLDERFGAGGYWLVLSADHGVSPTLEQARARGYPAKNVVPSAVQQAVATALMEKWGEDRWLVPGAGLILNRETLEKHGVGLDEAVRLFGEAAKTVDGIAGYVGARVSSMDKQTTAAVRRGLYAGRSADVVLVLEPFALFNGERGGATHGSHYSYDTHIPLIFYGSAFRPGRYSEKVSSTDVAPTLAAALGITPPSLATGRALVRALHTPASPPVPREVH